MLKSRRLVEFPLALIGFWVLGLMAGSGGAAVAHTSFGSLWSQDVHWVLDSTRLAPLNTSAAANQYVAADNVWNAISGSWFDFVYDGTMNLPNINNQTSGLCDNPPNPSKQLFIYGHDGIIGSSSGWTTTCVGIIHLNYAYVWASHTGTWYIGNNQPASNQWDFRALVTHEFGHATGSLNFDFNEADNTLCPSSSARQTMCSVLAQGINGWYQRTLATHDIHTVQSDY